MCFVTFFLLLSLTEDCCSDENISGEADGEGSVRGPAAGVTGASHPLFISSKRRNVCRIDRIERQARTLGVLNGFDLIFKRGLALLERKKKLHLIPDSELKGEFCFYTQAATPAFTAQPSVKNGGFLGCSPRVLSGSWSSALAPPIVHTHQR